MESGSPTLTMFNPLSLNHICLAESKVKKYVSALLLNAPSNQVIKLIHPYYEWRTLKKRHSFQTSEVEEAQGTILVIIHILSIISSPLNDMNK